MSPARVSPAVCVPHAQAPILPSVTGDSVDGIDDSDMLLVNDTIDSPALTLRASK